MSKRYLFFLYSVFFAVSLVLIEWVRLLYPVTGFWPYVGWLILVMALYFVVIKSDFSFPDQLLFSLLPFLTSLTYFTLLLVYLDTFFALFSWIVVGAGIVLMYVLLLTLNIVMVATVRTVPLLKAAHSILAVIVLGIGIVWTHLILVLFPVIEYAALVWAFLSFLLSISFLYASQVRVVEEFRSMYRIPFVEATLVGILQLFIVLLTSTWDITPLVRIIYWSSTLLTLLVIMQGRKKRTLTRNHLRELAVITWIIFIMVLINGLRG